MVGRPAELTAVQPCPSRVVLMTSLDTTPLSPNPLSMSPLSADPHEAALARDSDPLPPGLVTPAPVADQLQRLTDLQERLAVLARRPTAG